MSKYSQAVLAKKPEFSYLETAQSLKNTYSDGTKTAYNPRVFPYAKKFLYTILERVNDTYTALVEKDNREMLCRELFQQLTQDFRFDFSDHLGGMRQRDKRGAGALVEENDYNMFHSCYKFVNQAARAKSFGEKFNLSLMSGRVNTDNQTGPEICDPFMFGPALYLYSKNYAKVVAMTLPGYETPQKIATLALHEKEMKKDMFAQKASAAKALKSRWHYLINQEFMPAGLSFKDLSVETVKQLSALHADLLTALSTRVEQDFQTDVKMLRKVAHVFDKQRQRVEKGEVQPEDLAALQLASLHAMQANDILQDSSVVQVSIEAEKPIYKFLADVLEDDNSLTAKIFDHPATRSVFEKEMEKIHTTKDGSGYHSLLDKMVATNSSKLPPFAKVLGEEYQENLTRYQMAKVLRNGEAMPKVSFMLAVLLLETGAKIEGGSSQIVYAKKIKEALSTVFSEAMKYPEFDKNDLQQRRQVFEKFNYRTAQAQIWGVKDNGDILGYRSLLDRTVKVDDSLLDKVAMVSSQDAFEAAAVHRFYEFVGKEQMSDEEKTEQKERVKHNLLQFSDQGDYNNLLAPHSSFYRQLAQVIRSDENVKKSQLFQNKQVYLAEGKER